MSLFNYLSSLPHFSFIPEKEIKTIVDNSVIKGYSQGTILAEQNKTEITGVSIVRNGTISIYNIDGTGEKKIIGRIQNGGIFGGLSILLNNGISIRTAIAETDCTVCIIPKDIFQRFCASNKIFLAYFLENFSKQNQLVDESLLSEIESSQKCLFLKSIDPFSFLSQEEVEKLSKNLFWVTYPKGMVIFFQGLTRVGYVYILRKGLVHQYYEEQNNKILADILNEGDIYGGISLLVNDGISIKTLQTIEKSEFYLLPKQQFLDVCEHNKVFSEYFTNLFGEKMQQKTYAAIISKAKLSKEEDLYFFNQPLKSISPRKPIFCNENSTIQTAAKIMQREKISSLFVKISNDDSIGILTERDLSTKVIASGYDASNPVSSIMSYPAKTISIQSLIFEALIKLMESDIRHLAVTNSENKIIGVLSSRDLLTSQSRSPIFLLREIASAVSVSQLINHRKRLPELVRTLISKGTNSGDIIRFVSLVSNSILDRLIRFTVDELGLPPVAFSFMVFGSEERNEQTLVSDQDNAIVYKDPQPNMEPLVRRYFLKFGERTCTLLNQVGYSFCEGGYMAKNPEWCQPLSTWKSYFTRWINNADENDLLNASIFFDFRCGYGDKNLSDDLQQHLFETLQNSHGIFFRKMSKNAMSFRPPIGFFRNFVVESKGEHRDAFNIKNAMSPIVHYARIFALKNNIKETNTIERLSQLRQKKILSDKEYEELEKAFSFLVQLRLVHQITAIFNKNSQPDNYIKPKELTRIEQTMLKEIFRAIEYFQTKLSMEFRGLAR